MLKKEGDIWPLLTINEVSLPLNIHINTIKRWSDDGKIRAYHLGNCGEYRFDYEDIKRIFLENGTRISASN